MEELKQQRGAFQRSVKELKDQRMMMLLNKNLHNTQLRALIRTETYC